MELWKCPVMYEKLLPGVGDSQWWCGDPANTMPCQPGNNARLVSYTSGEILGIPPITSTLSPAMDCPSSSMTGTFSIERIVLSSSISTNAFSGVAEPTQTQHDSANLPFTKDIASTAHACTDAAATTQDQRQASSLPTAIGVGIGVPLAIASIGFPGFLFSRDAKSRHKRKPIVSSQRSNLGGDLGRSLVERDSRQPIYELEAGR